jgi:hypothetical protein
MIKDELESAALAQTLCHLAACCYLIATGVSFANNLVHTDLNERNDA